MNRMRNKLWTGPLLVIVFFGFSACGSSNPDISAYAQDSILIIGLLEEDFEITPEELLQLECTSGGGTGQSEKAGTVEVYGPTIDTFLAEYEKSRSDFTKIRVTAKDAYKKVIWGEMLTDGEIIFSIANGAEPLTEGQKPMRFFIPDADSSYWVYGIIELEFVTE